jgi:type I restriction enzyme, S subunit
MSKIKLKDIAESQTGPFGSQLHESDYVEMGTPIVTVEHLGEISFSTQNLPFVSDSDKERLSKYILKEGDIVFSRVGSVDRCTYVSKNEDGWLFSGRCLRVRVNKKRACPKFISYYFRQKNFKAMMLNISVGATMPSLNTSLMDSLPLDVPDLSTQQKISSVLSALDNKIELNNKINAELEAMAKTIYDYWFVQFDFPDKNGKPYKSSGGKMVYNQVLKREVPEEWEVGTLDCLGDIIGGSTPSKEITENFSSHGTPWITPKDLSLNGNNKFIAKGEFDVTDKGLKSASLKVMPAGTVLLSSRAPIGYMAIARNPLTTNQGFKSFVPVKKFSSPFVFYTIKNALPEIISNASGSTFKEVSASTLKTIKVCLSEKRVVEKYTETVVGIFERQNLLELENQKISELHDWLLPMLMNGQVSVSAAYEQVQDVLSRAAEAKSIYAKVIKLDIPKKEIGFAKQVLAGKIVSLFKDDRNFTRIKFQKLQFLAEHIAEADLNLNYYFQPAGPYDNRFMHTITHSFKKSKWFDEKSYKFISLEKHDQIEGYYQKYFTPASNQLSKLFQLLSNASVAETEITATVYAVWNNRIILKQPITKELLTQDFYNWSDRKHRYSKEQILEALSWLKQNGFEPRGFGKEIKRAKITKAK